MISKLHFSAILGRRTDCKGYSLSFVLLLLACILLSSCNITKFLSEDEQLVNEVGIEIISDEKSGDIADLKEELKKFYNLSPNKNFRSRNYYKYKDLEHPSWIKRWLKNKHSEPPSLLDTTKVNEAVSTIQNYLRNKKGFYQATVSYKLKEYYDRSVKVTYLVNTGNRYIINKLYHISQDSSLAELVEEISKNSILNDKDPIDAYAFDLEKQRIVSELKKRGYADFNFSNVEIKGDSTELTNSWDIFMLITPPAKAKKHQKFAIGDINVFTDFHQNQKETDLSSDYLFGKNYRHESKNFIVRPSTINRKIFLNKYETYDSDKYYKTIRSLFSLGSYKFAKITPQVNTTDSTLIDYNIFLTPHDSKWLMDTGLEAYYSNISILNSNIIGIAGNLGIEDRNAFGGSEKFKTTLEAGVEFNPTTLSVNTLGLVLNNKLEIPTLTKPFNILRPLNKFNLIKDEKFKVLQEEGKSNISLEFSYQDNLNLFKLFSVEAGYGYDFVLNSRTRLVFNQVGVNYTIYDVIEDSPFDSILMRDPVLFNSFKNNLFTGLLFKDLTWYYQSERGKRRSNVALISRLEFSGLEVFAANSIYNAITNQTDKWKIAGIDFERLAKLEFDFRWYQRAKERSQLATRIKTGIAIPLDKDRTVSYVKQFSVGGPSSIRAWRPMHLGPGSHLQDSIEFFFPKKDTTIFYQRGDLVLDLSLEYRFDLIWLMEGALFVDAGNIWTLREDPLRPGSKINSRFHSELAIGYGYGIRFDFNYFLIRFDLGFKLRYPNIIGSDGTRYRDSHWTGPKGQKFGTFNIAVNYPF